MEIALLGLGIVGGGVYNIVREREVGLHVKRVLDRRSMPGMEEVLTADMQAILDDPSIEVVVEAMGGEHPALEYVTAAMEAGKHVVTSNKQLVSRYYAQLHETAAQHGVQLRYTAAAGGGIPWLYNLQRAARCDDILHLDGIINGTTNFILDAMDKGASFPQALEEAQARGYAEADPSADLDGLDALRKCAISASLAFGGLVSEEAIPAKGIRSITAEDVAFFKEQKRICKLMIHAHRTPDGVCAYVEPTLVRESDPEAAVHGNYNYVSLTGRDLGYLSFCGQGAGREPTGSAVVQDVLDIARGLPFAVPSLAPVPVCNDEAVHVYYVRSGGKRYFTPPISVRQMHESGADFFAQMRK